MYHRWQRTNVACDPVAADYVFQSGMKITAVGLDVTMKVRFKRAYLDWIQTHCRPELKRAAEYLGKALNGISWETGQKLLYG
mgnify:CR=1 FL=1